MASNVQLEHDAQDLEDSLLRLPPRLQVGDALDGDAFYLVTSDCTLGVPTLPKWMCTFYYFHQIPSPRRRNNYVVYNIQRIPQPQNAMASQQLASIAIIFSHAVIDGQPLRHAPHSLICGCAHSAESGQEAGQSYD